MSFFPGDKGRWHLACEEVTRPSKPLPQCDRDQWYEMSRPVGYDKSQYRMEMVILDSRDGLKTWQVISREPCRFHHSAGSFGQARTKDGRFLRFVWSCYSLDPGIKPKHSRQNYLPDLTIGFVDEFHSSTHHETHVF